jgi:hypothetical protein
MRAIAYTEPKSNNLTILLGGISPVYSFKAYKVLHMIDKGSMHISLLRIRIRNTLENAVADMEIEI